ncbi:NeuD/PglB/VioB family sugar acetyltransferase [Massilibacteroides sp.]|uniref:NeuD/PglB/VioB family sugar acetyltransferase n=1 Tax=Massilibacteroides sp. TaxID=2034766 RepID=UPI0026371137|nr:NeuD/PglB/VioB family sugar acetyltransferase [Massilibacteroides sp.]MDD4515960.1 NeuD/PglB/VioB family sugar acetyltransferase [Massilibacteroides sp.]
MKKIAVYGAGGFGREIACLIHIINQKSPQWDFIGFFDDGKEIGTSNEYGQILGGIKELNKITYPLDLAIAIGKPTIVAHIVENIKNENINFPNIISPDVIFLDGQNCKMGKGNIICSGCLFSCNLLIGDFNIFNGFIPVGHDSVIGNYNAFMPNVKISGEVTIGDRNFFGVSSIVLQQIRIGNTTTIGANSLVIKKTKDGLTYLGSPAKAL